MLGERQVFRGGVEQKVVGVVFVLGRGGWLGINVVAESLPVKEETSIGCRKNQTSQQGSIPANGEG